LPAIQHREITTITAWWAVAAARLQPENASAILHAAMERFQEGYYARERCALCVALWQLVGEPESRFLVDWLYGEKVLRGEFPGCRAEFTRSVGTDRTGKKLIARIIQDRRFDTLDGESLVQLVRVVNGWRKTPLVSEEEIRQTWHQYPKETEEVLQRLAEWRARLRASVPQWLP
jgi:hypothetical protein